MKVLMAVVGLKKLEQTKVYSYLCKKYKYDIYKKA